MSGRSTSHWRHDPENARAVDYMATHLPWLLEHAAQCDAVFVEIIARSWRESIVPDGHLVAIDVLERTQERFDRALAHARAGEGELAREAVEEVEREWLVE